MSSSQHVTEVVNQCKIFTFLKKIDQTIIIINHSDIVPYHTMVIMTKQINKNASIPKYYYEFGL